MRIQYSIILVSDMARSVIFYRDVLGMPLKFESPGWTEFATEGATLALHTVEGAGSASGPADGSPQEERAGQCKAGFQVPDLAEFHARMVEKKVQCVQEPTEAFGVKIAQYVDPDGLVLSVAQA